MRKKVNAVFIPWRFNLLVLLLLLIISGLMVRLVELAVFKKNFLQTQGDARALRTVTSPAFRGVISDREGNPLAVSTAVYSIWMNPQEFVEDKQSLKSLAQCLNTKPAALLKIYKLHQDMHREFVYLKRDVPPEWAKRIKALNIPGIYREETYKRFYPEGEVAAHVVGFTNIDDSGQEGLELAFNPWLAGTPGKQQVIKDRLGRVIAHLQQVTEKKSGHDLVLSIHRRIQYLAYRALMAGVQETAAESGSAVIINVKTGEILAMVNVPSYNPNHRPVTHLDWMRNRAVTDVFEPGSTIKAFSVASALDSGKFSANTIINTHPGWIRVGHNLVQDEHNLGPLSVLQILQHSSNVGITKIILSLQPNQLRDLLHRVGFGEMTHIGFPGERSGELPERKIWSPFGLATFAFGYGLSVTPLQLAQAYSVIANHGIKVPLSLLRVETPPVGERVMKAEVANQMLNLLESVVAKGGTGRPAHIPGYRVAGKTGTAKIVGKSGYEKHRYVASFVGIAPASHPYLVVAVVIRDPKGKRYLGGDVAGPVFKKIMEGALHLFNVPTDAISDQNKA